MSLFPAYTDVKATNEDYIKLNEKELSFSSFKINAPTTSKIDVNNITKVSEASENSSSEIISSSDTDSSYERRKRKKKSSKKHKRRKTSEKIELKNTLIEDDFIVDKSRELVYLKVKKISRPSVSKYRYLHCTIGDFNPVKKKKKRLKRYYDIRYKDVEDKTKIEETPQNKAEEDITKKTGFYNQQLGKDPFNVDMWLEYVKFQDQICLFEKTYKKGSIAKAGRVTAERKLAILDKALTHNPNNDILSREKVITAETVYPADELGNYLRNFVEKNPGNIIFWQGYIEATQCSMAHCNTPSVIDLYNKCLTKLHQLRRGTLEKSLLEERILSMLYQCGLFLRQAGLWEQLWTLLQLYLELNLSSNKFKINYRFDDKQLIELEEVIFESQLPLHELWLRVEKLRESCHWLPSTGTEPCEDPQRMVFIDDVSDLIHPITSTGNTFRLTVMILTVLKIPLLPLRHCTMQELGLDYVPWALDTIETLYSVFYPLYPLDLKNKYLLKDLIKLAVGPQYLKTHPGQEEYLNFLTTLMRNCGDCLQNTERTALFVWWLRFEQLLIVLDKDDRFKMPTGRNKKTKSTIKDFLKDERNRNNVVFYREYALIEHELGNFDSACKILMTAITMLSNGNPVIVILNRDDRAGLCSLYRTLIELYLKETTNTAKAIEYLVILINGTCPDGKLSDDYLLDIIQKYEHIITELLREKPNNLSVSEQFLPDYVTDLIICYGWLLYLVRTTFEAGTMIEKILENTAFTCNENAWRREVLMEWYVTIFYKTCSEKLGAGMYGLFNDILQRALTTFPNNLFLLSVACKEQSASECVGKPWWKLNNLLSNCGHAMPALFLVIIANQQLSKIKDKWDKFDIDNPVNTLSTFKNRISSIFQRLTKHDICTKRCGLLWRLYLQFLYTYSDSEACRKAYYAAVEECPWLKALYIDAAIYIPAELSQIQDLIIEKQLRIHVTPEELDVLRS